MSGLKVKEYFLWIYLIQTKTKVLSGLPLEGDSGEEVAL
jgi:hypothetical protein